MGSLADFAKKHGAQIIKTYSTVGKCSCICSAQRGYSRALLLLPDGRKRRAVDLPNKGWRWA